MRTLTLLVLILLVLAGMKAADAGRHAVGTIRSNNVTMEQSLLNLLDANPHHDRSDNVSLPDDDPPESNRT